MLLCCCMHVQEEEDALMKREFEREAAVNLVAAERVAAMVGR